MNEDILKNLKKQRRNVSRLSIKLPTEKKFRCCVRNNDGKIVTDKNIVVDTTENSSSRNISSEES